MFCAEEPVTVRTERGEVVPMPTLPENVEIPETMNAGVLVEVVEVALCPTRSSVRTESVSAVVCPASETAKYGKSFASPTKNNGSLHW